MKSSGSDVKWDPAAVIAAAKNVAATEQFSLVFFNQVFAAWLISGCIKLLKNNLLAWQVEKTFNRETR